MSHTDEEWNELSNKNIYLENQCSFLSRSLEKTVDGVFLLRKEIGELTKLKFQSLGFSFLIVLLLSIFMLNNVIEGITFEKILAVFFYIWFFSVMSYWGSLVFIYNLRRNKDAIKKR